ncbi:MAG: ribosome silencing factor [Deltaproteobacteria bacterium]|nr:ribosome silencing factor [Deltaproteobacteria bacterium]
MESKKKALEIAKLALDKKAEKVVILNIAKLSSIADYLLICSAQSERQVHAVAVAIEDGLKKKGVRPMGTEGAREGRWALVDYGDVIAHVFFEPVREFYDLEGLWAEAPLTEVKDTQKPAPKKTGKRAIPSKKTGSPKK